MIFPPGRHGEISAVIEHTVGAWPTVLSPSAHAVVRGELEGWVDDQTRRDLLTPVDDLCLPA